MTEWTCSACYADVDEGFDVCWNCGTSRDGTPDPEFGLDDGEQPAEVEPAGSGSPASTRESKAVAPGKSQFFADYGEEVSQGVTGQSSRENVEVRRKKKSIEARKRKRRNETVGSRTCRKCNAKFDNWVQVWEDNSLGPFAPRGKKKVWHYGCPKCGAPAWWNGRWSGCVFFIMLIFSGFVLAWLGC